MMRTTALAPGRPHPGDHRVNRCRRHERALHRQFVSVRLRLRRAFYRADTVTDLNHEGIGGVPALFKSFTQQSGLDYDVSLETRGGSGLDFHLARSWRIGSRPWDTVVMHGFSLLDAAEAARSREADCHQQADGGVPARQESQGRALPDLDLGARRQRLSGERRVARPDRRGDDEDVRAAYDQAAKAAGVKTVIPVGEIVAARDADRRRRSESLRRHRGGQAQSLDLRLVSRQHARLLPAGAGDLRDADRARSALARRQRVLGYELGMSRAEVRALQQVAFDQIAAMSIPRRLRTRRKSRLRRVDASRRDNHGARLSHGRAPSTRRPAAAHLRQHPVDEVVDLGDAADAGNRRL